MTETSQQFETPSKVLPMVANLGLVGIIGFFDYVTGFELHFFAFYLIPIILAVWFMGGGYGILVSILCVTASTGSDIIAGAHYSSKLVPVWNSLMALASYAAVVWLLTKLRALNNELEKRVRERTAALNNEMQERMRLEDEILRVSEHERRRIGYDLHDSLCQHLTGTALAVQVLGGQLTESSPQSDAANHIVELVEEAIELTREMARGLSPVELKGGGLMDALRELADVIRERFKIPCRFECDEPVFITDPGKAVHLYRIAQEALNNAVKHSHAKGIVVCLEAEEEFIRLTVSDDGVGLPENRKSDGMGLRIMAYRASIIGAVFKVERLPAGGTRATCTMPTDGGPLTERYAPEKQSSLN